MPVWREHESSIIERLGEESIEATEELIAFESARTFVAPLPHNVPEQPTAGFGPLVAPPDSGVVTTGPKVTTPGEH